MSELILKDGSVASVGLPVVDVSAAFKDGRGRITSIDKSGDVTVKFDAGGGATYGAASAHSQLSGILWYKRFVVGPVQVWHIAAGVAVLGALTSALLLWRRK